MSVKDQWNFIHNLEDITWREILLSEKGRCCMTHVHKVPERPKYVSRK